MRASAPARAIVWGFAHPSDKVSVRLDGGAWAEATLTPLRDDEATWRLTLPATPLPTLTPAAGPMTANTSGTCWRFEQKYKIKIIVFSTVRSGKQFKATFVATLQERKRRL